MSALSATAQHRVRPARLQLHPPSSGEAQGSGGGPRGGQLRRRLRPRPASPSPVGLQQHVSKKKDGMWVPPTCGSHVSKTTPKTTRMAKCERF